VRDVKWIAVTAALPAGAVEAFLLPELRTLAALGHEVVLVPVRPQGNVVHADGHAFRAHLAPLFSPRISIAALTAFARAPRAAVRVLASVIRDSRSLGVMLKNLAVFPKALWLAEVARTEGADHVHACFASTPATLAYVAHAMTNTPWSMTGHRWDIAEDNLLAAKARSARFVRAIDSRGRRTLEHHSATRVTTLRVGVDVPAPRPPRPPAPALRVVVAARLAEVKGHRYLLEAIPHVAAPIHVDVIGDGSLAQRVRCASPRTSPSSVSSITARCSRAWPPATGTSRSCRASKPSAIGRASRSPSSRQWQQASPSSRPTPAESRSSSPAAQACSCPSAIPAPSRLR
jgi:colanic acid/amylovoran biosynthesis glycosyltransferase